MHSVMRQGTQRWSNHPGALRNVTPSTRPAMHQVAVLLQDRDTARRQQGKRPKCHFFNSFFVNKLIRRVARTRSHMSG